VVGGEEALSRIWLVRHGQAGTRAEYDSLSLLGREQAQLLGRYLASQPVEFAAAFSGTLARQQSTAEETRAAYESAGRSFPVIGNDCGWNEFDLADVYRALAPRLCADDEAFRGQWEEMERQAQANAGLHSAGVHRRWMPCDRQLIETWIEGRYAYEGESWSGFRRRVLECRARLAHFGREDNVLVFTSATPIAIWAATAFDMEDGRTMKLAGALLNTSCSLMRLGPHDLRLHSFNVVSHLLRPDLQTYR
jgi:broad specificity phosphatase PhoE